MLKIFLKNKDKFSNTSNNFNFKVTIIYNKYREVRLSVDTYIYSTLIMLFDQTQMHYYTNYNNTFIFD